MSCLADVSSECVFQQVEPCSTATGSGVTSVVAGAGITVSGTTTVTVSLDLTYAAAWTAAQSWTVTDANNSSAVDVITVAHTPSGSAAAGLGTSVLLRSKNSSGAVDAARISALMNTVTAASEVEYTAIYGLRSGSLEIQGWGSSTSSTSGIWNSGAFYLSTLSGVTPTNNGQIQISGNNLNLNVLTTSVSGFSFTGSDAATTGARSFFSITPLANTTQTASTEINGFVYNSFTRQWTNGNFATQREAYFKSPTYTFTSATTITNAFNLYADPPIAGTNATFTNTYALGLGGNMLAAGHLLPSSSSTFNLGSANLKWATAHVDAVLSTTSSGNLTVGVSGTGFTRLGPSTGYVRTRGTQTSGTSGSVEILGANHTGLTASTEVAQVTTTLGTMTWAAGAITNQRFFQIAVPTAAFASASTITNAATFYVAGSPTAGTNATITNAWSAWFGSKIHIDAAVAVGSTPATLGNVPAGGTAAQTEWIEVWTENGRRSIPAWTF